MRSPYYAFRRFTPSCAAKCADRGDGKRKIEFAANYQNDKWLVDQELLRCSCTHHADPFRIRRLESANDGMMQRYASVARGNAASGRGVSAMPQAARPVRAWAVSKCIWASSSRHSLAQPCMHAAFGLKTGFSCC